MKLCHNTALEPYSVRLLLGLLRMEARVLMMMGMQLVQLLKGMPLNKVSLTHYLPPTTYRIEIDHDLQPA